MAGRPQTATAVNESIDEGDADMIAKTKGGDVVSAEQPQTDTAVDEMDSYGNGYGNGYENRYETQRIARQAALTAKLAERVPDSELRTRKGANNIDLAYVSADYVIRKANEIFGTFEWTSHVDSIECNFDYGVAIARVTVTADTGTHSGVGTGTAVGTVKRDDKGAPVFDLAGEPMRKVITPEQWEMAIKGAESDALKRAFINFGDAFGLFLREKGESTGGFSGGSDRPVTENQLKFINTLIDQNPSRRALLPADPTSLTSVEASAIIDQMKMIRPDEGTPRAPAAPAPRENVDGKATSRQVAAIMGMFTRLAEHDENVAQTAANNFAIRVEYPADFGAPTLQTTDVEDMTSHEASDFIKNMRALIDVHG